MNLDDWYAQVKGQVLDIDGHPADAGQCVQTVDDCLHKVYNQPYHYGNAIDWWNNPGELLNNFDKISDGSIKKGDFVVYGTGVGSQYGHIDVAAQDGTTASYLGYDSNWGGDLTVHEVNHNDHFNQFILGSLRFKGEDMSDIADHDFVADACVLGMDLQPETNQVFMNNIGLPKSQVLKNILGYQESRNLRLRAEAYDSLQTEIATLKAQTTTGGPAPTTLNKGVYEVK